jgi:hypothetical protein
MRFSRTTFRLAFLPGARYLKPRRSRTTLVAVLTLLAFNGANLVFAQTDGRDSAAPAETPRQYTYAWLFADDSTMRPRGGTTQGPSVTLDTAVSTAFQAIHAPDLTAQERDRRAILAMAGDYRTSFDFIETIGFTASYTPRAPYQSWGTERVYVVEDRKDFVSLQHIIVMHFALEDGSVSEPMVVKHWRQDWHYQDRDVHAYQGSNGWAPERLAQREARGSWTQTVYQVDDSPRYEAQGRWEHSPSASIWTSERRRRPLPRREFSVRDDYQALVGTHRISLYHNGWTQEEDSLKLVLDDNNQPSAALPYLAREAGLSRYERIRDYDFSAGDAYWKKTGRFWQQVRAYWTGVFDENTSFALHKTVEGQPLFMAMFTLAEDDSLSDDAMAATIAKTIDAYLIR